ncbi:MAG TPA: AMP-binding protein [Solirubrobacteraceae bacterium]|jgi:fatty-acyl-CoA synthase
MDVSGWIAHWASWSPEKTALRFEGRQISYAVFERDVGLVAAWLRACGVLPGDRVGYLGPSCPELLVVLFASARLGAIFVPLNSRMPAAELRVFVDHTRPRLVVAERGFREIALDSVGALEDDRVEAFVVGGELAGRDAQPVAASSSVDAAAPALILFTSGTTGRPKGATFAHENIIFNALNVITALCLTGADEILVAVPMFHTGGLFIHTLPGLCAGATITIHRQFEPGQLLAEIQRRRVTLLACVPAMTFALSADPGWDSADLGSIRHVFTGSTVVTRSAIEPWQAKGVRIGQGYGSTEACPTATVTPPASPPAAALMAGKPTLHTQIRIVDESGCDVPAGQAGEVWLRGPAVMRGYWENAHATREAFCEGWFRTGDGGLIDDDGYLRIVGRINEIIIVGGSNVYPSDVEAVLEGCGEIREAAVVGRPDEELGEVPIACVVPTPGRSLSREQVIARFANRLAAYKHPRDVIFLDELPRNWHGKIDRPLLRLLATQGPHEPHSSTVPARRTLTTERS